MSFNVIVTLRVRTEVIDYSKVTAGRDF